MSIKCKKNLKKNVKGLCCIVFYARVYAEIDFVGIMIGILIEISFDFPRNYFSKLSQAIGILISANIR
jgi:hypothetical protein